MEELGDDATEVLEPEPDVHALFWHYNSLYFDDSLDSCVVSWNPSRLTRCAGICRYLQEGGCEIQLSEPLLKFRSTTDLKNTLLHEMIHAFIYIISHIKDHSYHGPKFTAKMNSINSSSVTDPLRPSDGYNITIYHYFQNEVDSNRVYHWICETCGNLIKRAMNREPSAIDCIEHKGTVNSCSNMSCHWHMHNTLCSGRYIKMVEPQYKGKRRVLEDEHVGDGEKSKRPLSYTTRRAAERLPNTEARDKSMIKKTKEITKFFPSVVDAAANSGNKFPSRDNPHNHKGSKSKQLKTIELKYEDIAFPFKIPKKQRTQVCRAKRKYKCIEDRPKVRKREIAVAVAIPWLEYYEYDESEEEIEPLVNKRTERRKKQKLLKELGGFPDTEVMEDTCLSQASDCTDPPLLCCKDGEGRGPITTFRRKASQGSYKLNSPPRDNVVYISDS